MSFKQLQVSLYNKHYFKFYCISEADLGMTLSLPLGFVCPSTMSLNLQ